MTHQQKCCEYSEVCMTLCHYNYTKFKILSSHLVQQYVSCTPLNLFMLLTNEQTRQYNAQMCFIMFNSELTKCAKEILQIIY
jgi:hypothetical protein